MAANGCLGLGGLGMRELACDGAALLILAGPTMDLDGPVVLYRWQDALAAGKQTVVPADRLERVLHLPYGSGEDHAEGFCRLSGAGGDREELLVVHDSPAAARLHDGTAIEADLFRLERHRPGQRRVAD